MNLRYFSTFILIILIIVSPWWIYTAALVILTITYPFYIEGIIVSFIIEALYSPAKLHISPFNFPLALIITLLIIFLIPIRKHIRLHA